MPSKKKVHPSHFDAGSMLIYLTLILPLTQSVDIPSYPDSFKVRIRGTLLSRNNSFTLEQYYSKTNGIVVGKTIFNDDSLMIGYIYDEVDSHSIRYNFTDCKMQSIPSKSFAYEPFDLFSHQETKYFGLVDAFLLFQNASLNITNESAITDGISRTTFTHTTDHDEIKVIVNDGIGQVEEVWIERGENRLLLEYGVLVVGESVATNIAIPPHDIFCKADINHQITMPTLGPFYSLEVRILSQYYKKQESLGIVKIAEYVHDGLLSIGYHASTDRHVHYINIVHNFRTGMGAVINKDSEICEPYILQYPGNVTDQEKKDLFRTGVLGNMHFFERKYFVLFWQVLELVKSGSAEWQYQGIRTIDSTQCNVWSIVVHESWIAEVAFSVAKIRLRENSHSNKLQALPTSVSLWRVDAHEDVEPAIAFRISDFQIDSNPVSTELMFDSSACYEGINDSCVVQFRLDVNFETAFLHGLGNVKRAIVDALCRKTQIEEHQIHHMSISPVPDGHSLVTLSVYQGFGNSLLGIQLFKERVKAAVDSRMYLTFTNDDTTKIQVAHSVPESLIFDYHVVSKRHWSVSVAATISLCIGTTFIGLILGMLVVNCWNRKRMLGKSGSSPNYRRFKEEEIEEVDIGMQ